jgi:hypothetical protein
VVQSRAGDRQSTSASTTKCSANSTSDEHSTSRSSNTTTPNSNYAAIPGGLEPMHSQMTPPSQRNAESRKRSRSNPYFATSQVTITSRPSRQSAHSPLLGKIDTKKDHYFMELTMLPPEKEVEVKPLDDERAAVFLFTEMTQVSRLRPRPAAWSPKCSPSN